MEFLVLDRHTVTYAIPGASHLVISIRDPRHTFPDLPHNQQRIGTLRQSFADIDREDTWIQAKKFDSSLADEVLGFVFSKVNEASLILCQCDGGVSRSSAMAAALSVILDGSGADAQFFEHPRYLPNMLVYKTVLQRHFGPMVVQE